MKIEASERRVPGERVLCAATDTGDSWRRAHPSLALQLITPLPLLTLHPLSHHTHSANGAPDKVASHIRLPTNEVGFGLIREVIRVSQHSQRAAAARRQGAGTASQLVNSAIMGWLQYTVSSYLSRFKSQ